MSEALPRELTAIEARVLGCLVEKEATTPDQYPLTVNALRNACNQKTSREPVMDLTEGEVGHALRELEAMDLTRQAWSSRAARWEHLMDKRMGLLPRSMAALAVLMLRGPQTAAEIRAHSQRLHEFPDTDDVEYTLGRLADLDSPLVEMLPRQPGQKGERYVHLLCGEPDPAMLTAVASASPRAAARSELEERIATLETQVAALTERLDSLEEEG